MLPPKEKLRLLSMVDILEPLSREEIKELSLRVPDTHIEQGRIFYTPYERVEALFMLKRGRVRIYWGPRWPGVHARHDRPRDSFRGDVAHGSTA